MDPKSLLEQFLGPDAGKQAADLARGATTKVRDSGLGGIGGGLAAGGLLGLLVGSKKMRKTVGKLAGGAIGYGGAAALGALGYRAYQNWQSNQATAPARPPEASKFLPAAAPANDGRPFELALVTAMVAAANADGHIDAAEQRSVFEQVKALPLDAQAKAFVFDLLDKPPALNDIAGLAQGPEQAAELYLASRLAIDPDHPAEQAYLEALAGRLGIEPELAAELERQVEGA